MSNPGKVVRDTCGNLYESDGTGSILETPINGGAVVNLGPYQGYGGVGLGIDSNNDIFFSTLYSTQVGMIPSVNCVPQLALEQTVANNFGNLTPPIYYYDPVDVAIDSSGNLFIADGNTGEIFEESASGTPSVLTPTGFFNVYSTTFLAIDSAGNLFLTDGTNLYEVPAGATAGTNIGSGLGLNSPKGVSVDSQGNLFVIDSGNSRVLEVPNTGTVQVPVYVAANAFSVLNVSAGASAAVDPLGNLYYGATAYLPPSYSGTGVIYKVSFANFFGSVTVGQTSSATLSFLFNVATTPEGITYLGGAAAGGPFSNAGGGSCATGTAYTAGQNCTLNLTYKATLPGLQTGAVELTDTNGNALATGSLSGIGQGGGLTIDPGTTAAIGSGFKKPDGIAIDAAGNIYVADAGNNAILEFPAGGGASVSIGSGLSAPEGVAVDGAGDVFIADTGNNRVVEVPVVNGVLSNAAQILVQSGFNGPSGLAVDGAGDLYIADTGNNQITLLPNFGGTFDAALTAELGSQLDAPLAVAVSSSGNIYIADSGNGQIVEIVPGTSGQELVAVGLSNPSALAVDASGSLIVVDQGNLRILRIPSEGGILNPNDEIEIGFGVADPYGAALDTVGNLYVTDSINAAAYSISRTQGELAFGDWSVGSTSGTLSSSVEDSGNQPVTFSSPLLVATGNTGDFTVQSPGNACASGGTLAVGTDCAIAAVFAPTALGLRSDTLSLGSNAVNSATWSVLLTGTGTSGAATTTTLALTSPSSGSPFFGQAITVTATVAPVSGTGTPTGTVTFLVDGVQQTPVALINGVATLTLSDGLSGGSHTIAASYGGDANFSGSTATPLQFTVTQAPTTTTVVVTTPFINPLSALTGTSISVSATVASTGKGIPTGTLSFMNGSAVLATLPVAPQSGGTFGATFTTSSLAAGIYNITVVYSGDANYLSSTSSLSVVTIVVAPISVVVSGGNSVTSNASQAGLIGLTINSYGGWTGIVDFQCSGLPVYATCTAVPGYATVNVGTAANQLAPTIVQIVFKIDVPPTVPTASLLISLSSGTLGIVVMAFRRRKGAHRQFIQCVGMVLLLIGVLHGVAACGGGGTPGVNPKYVTPAGTSTVTITAIPDQFVTNGNGATKPPDPSQSFQVTFTVQ